MALLLESFDQCQKRPTDPIYDNNKYLTLRVTNVRLTEWLTARIQFFFFRFQDITFGWEFCERQMFRGSIRLKSNDKYSYAVYGFILNAKNL